jgi:hypothetical protein
MIVKRAIIRRDRRGCFSEAAMRQMIQQASLPSALRRKSIVVGPDERLILV